MGARANTVSVDGETLREEGACCASLARSLDLPFVSPSPMYRDTVLLVVFISELSTENVKR